MTYLPAVSNKLSWVTTIWLCRLQCRKIDKSLALTVIERRFQVTLSGCLCIVDRGGKMFDWSPPGGATQLRPQHVFRVDEPAVRGPV